MNNEIKALQSELALLKLQFSERVNNVESRLNTLLAQEEQQKNTTKTEKHTTQSPNELTKQPTINLDNSSSIKPVYQPEHVPTEPKKPSAISLFLQSFIQHILSILFEWLTPATNLYKSYKEKGMLGIFILTIAGIALVLAGFGYLMQLLIDQLGAGSKSLLMCFAAISVMALGIGLKIKTKFSEFATAIVTLGILLSYCTIYFSGSVYGILPNVIVLLLYFIIALVCHILATWLDTKIVSSLGIIGISTMPILSNTVQIEPLYYLLSLAFIVTSSLFFAYKHGEKWLANLTLASTLITLEWVISVENIQISAWAINLFYVVFFIYSALTLFTHQKPYKQHLLFIAALVGSSTLLFFQASELFSTQMSMCFIFNTLLALATSVLFYKIKHEVTPFIILLTALWGVIAIVSAIGNAYWGIAWAIEGLLLLYIGRKYALTFVSNQGQVLLTFALIYSWGAIAKYFPLPALKSVNGWVLSLAIVCVIAIWQRMISPQGFDKRAQYTIKPLLQLLEVLWLSVLLITSSHIWLGYWTGALVLTIQSAILFRARYCKQVSLEIFAALLIIIPAFYIYQGMLQTDSYRFTTLPLFAKLAVISAFAQLWLWSAFYRKYLPDSPIKHITETARILFYLLIPICWLGSAIRQLNENTLLILWLSPALALLLAQKIKHQSLIAETKLLTVLASISLVCVIGWLTLSYSLLALIGFILFYGVSYLLHKKSPDHIYQFICSWGLISLGFAIPITIGVHTNALLFAIFTSALYWSSCLFLMDRSNHLQRNKKTIYILCSLLVMASWVLTQTKPIYTIIPVLFLLIIILKKAYFSNAALIAKHAKNTSHLLLHSVSVITYLSLFSSLSQYKLDLFIAPLLAIHGAIILFLKNRHITTVRYSFGLILLGIAKLALIDAANALLWQKVILFMGIGAFILVASFWYQKLIKRLEHSADLSQPQEQLYSQK